MQLHFSVYELMNWEKPSFLSRRETYGMNKHCFLCGTKNPQFLCSSHFKKAGQIPCRYTLFQMVSFIIVLQKDHWHFVGHHFVSVVASLQATSYMFMPIFMLSIVATTVKLEKWTRLPSVCCWAEVSLHPFCGPPELLRQSRLLVEPLW